MRLEDDQVKTALSIKKEMAIGTGWKIESEDQDTKEFITHNFENLNAEDFALDSTFDDALKDMTSFLEYGFSLTEPVWDLGSDDKWMLKNLKTRPPHSFKFHIDGKGSVSVVLAPFIALSKERINTNTRPKSEGLSSLGDINN